jgi:hypothetical protein
MASHANEMSARVDERGTKMAGDSGSWLASQALPSVSARERARPSDASSPSVSSSKPPNDDTSDLAWTLSRLLDQFPFTHRTKADSSFAWRPARTV